MSILGVTQPTESQKNSSDDIVDVSTQSFMKDVIEASTTQLVLVDFWAPWCGPCKQLGPIIEKVVASMNGKVRLAKLNIDEHPEIPGQMGIQSIPTVYAFLDGRPIDGFMGVQSETQIKDFIHKHLPDTNDGNISELLEQAEAAASSQQFELALELYYNAIAHAPENIQAHAGIILSLVNMRNLEEAQEHIEALEDDILESDEMKSAIASLEIAKKAPDQAQISALISTLDSHPEDHQARLELSETFAAHGKKDDAVDQLMKIISVDRDWNEDGARKKLLEYFEAWGHKDHATIAGRRKLSAILFS